MGLFVVTQTILLRVFASKYVAPNGYVVPFHHLLRRHCSRHTVRHCRAERLGRELNEDQAKFDLEWQQKNPFTEPGFVAYSIDWLTQNTDLDDASVVDEVESLVAHFQRGGAEDETPQIIGDFNDNVLFQCFTRGGLASDPDLIE